MSPVWVLQPYNKAWGKHVKVWYAQDYGAIVRRPGGLGFWASNDMRLELVGVERNTELVQPTLGPFYSKESAARAYAKWRDVELAEQADELHLPGFE